MKKQERRHFTPEQKSQSLCEHHLDKVPVAELCERHQLQPSVFYGWQRALFERAPQVFLDGKKTPPRASSASWAARSSSSRRGSPRRTR